MIIQQAKALIGLCIDEGLKQRVLKNKGEFEELLDYLDKYFIDTDKTVDGSSEIPKDLEEAAEHYASVTDPEAHGIDFIREVFIAGAKWQKELMMSGAIEAVARPWDKEIWCDLDKFPELEDGDDIRIIIVKEN